MVGVMGDLHAIDFGDGALRGRIVEDASHTESELPGARPRVILQDEIAIGMRGFFDFFKCGGRVGP